MEKLDPSKCEIAGLDRRIFEYELGTDLELGDNTTRRPADDPSLRAGEETTG